MLLIAQYWNFKVPLLEGTSATGKQPRGIVHSFTHQYLRLSKNYLSLLRSILLLDSRKYTLKSSNVFLRQAIRGGVVSRPRMKSVIPDPVSASQTTIFIMFNSFLRLTGIWWSSRLQMWSAKTYGSALSNTTDELGLKKVWARWVPRLLTPDQKVKRL